MIPLLDTNTPIAGTPVSEWQRQVGNCCDGRVVHALNNQLAALVAIRYEADGDGWTPALLARDRVCEANLRATIRHRQRQGLPFCDLPPPPCRLHRYSCTALDLCATPSS